MITSRRSTLRTVPVTLRKGFTVYRWHTYAERSAFEKIGRAFSKPPQGKCGGTAMPSKRGVLAIGNFDSNVGYAWRLMESLWCSLARVTASPDWEMRECYSSRSSVIERTIA